MNHAPRVVLPEAAARGRIELDNEDTLHLTKALRLGAGAEVEVLDGRGAAWRGVLSLDRRSAWVEVVELLRTEAAPGTADAVLPRIEVWAPLPKGPRAQDCLARLTQLGIAVWQPLVTRHTEAEARADGDGRREKLERTARESLKQCGRLHAVEVRTALALEHALAPEQTFWRDRTAFLLSPGAPTSLSTALGLRFEGRPKPLHQNTLQLFAGPEAGFASDEVEALTAAGAISVRLSPHVLRIETALEAAAAIASERMMRH